MFPAPREVDRYLYINTVLVVKIERGKNGFRPLAR